MDAINSYLLATLILALLIGAILAGQLLGRRAKHRYDDKRRDHTLAISGSLLGITGLVLGFALSESLARFDALSRHVSEEANAIGTAALRLDLLDQEPQAALRRDFGEYVRCRIADSMLSLDQADARQANHAATMQLQTRIWAQAVAALRSSDRPQAVALLVNSLNETFDARDARDCELRRHVPGLVMALLVLTAITSALMLGYGAGISQHRVSVLAYVLHAVVVVLILVIVDLDRPRRGLIRVDQTPIVELGADLPP
jgi:MFS family permease